MFLLFVGGPKKFKYNFKNSKKFLRNKISKIKTRNAKKNLTMFLSP